jgi:hypothetical protein
VGGYRVAAEGEDDPLAIDEALCRRQRWNQRFLVHGLVSLISVGFWLPVLVGWMAVSPWRVRAFAAGYRVQISGGVLTVGNQLEARSIPLDAIADVTVTSGYVNVSVRGAQVLAIFGLRDPLAASRAILEAREAHVRGLRSELREDVVEAEIGVDPRRARGRA